MTDHLHPPLPEWIYQRDGRLVPFDADRICRSLFTATEQLGQPDAFTARELTDSVLHFLAAETEGGIPTTSQVMELAAKVVRELGHPALSQALNQAEPEAQARITRACASGSEVFARELVSAHEEGLLTLTGLEAPLELSGWLLGPPAQMRVVEAVEEARKLAGVFLAVDGPEYLLTPGLRSVPFLPGEVVRELTIGLRATGLDAVVNLNSAVPPSWASDLAEGPLFAEQRSPLSPSHLTELTDALLASLLDTGQNRPRIAWHLGERDFQDAENQSRLAGIVRLALEGAPLAFAFDRPRRAVRLAEGIDRQHPAVLMTVGLHLPRLAEQLERRQSSGTTCDPPLFLEKLGSLIRLALSAGIQKRDFLRRQNRPWPAFLLDRARLVVAPVGLEAVVRRLTGARPCAAPAALELAQQIVQRISETLRHDGQAAHLDTCLDAANSEISKGFTIRPHQQATAEESVAGVTLWDAIATLKQQLKAVSALQGAAGCGTAALLLAEDQTPNVEEVIELLRWTWRQSTLPRLRLVRAAAPAM